MRVRIFGWWLGGLCLVAMGAGCAHNHGNNYAYAPPYAPPVYPQPGVAQPVSYAAPASAGPAVGAPGPMVAGGAVVAGGPLAAQSTPCPQGCPEGTVVGSPVVVEGGGQTPPCPPGP